MVKFRAILALLFAVTLAACTAESIWAPEDQVQRAIYRHDGPPTLTLFTVINNRSEAGAHSALMVSGSQRVLFDPAGSWYHPKLPERNDVHFGITDPAVVFYVDYHTRITYRTIVQEIEVSPQVAEMALQLVMSNGAVGEAYCSRSVSGILRQLPGFESIKQTWFPNKLMESFAKLPGVTTETFYDDDPDDNDGFITAYGI